MYISLGEISTLNEQGLKISLEMLEESGFKDFLKKFQPPMKSGNWGVVKKRLTNLIAYTNDIGKLQYLIHDYKGAIDMINHNMKSITDPDVIKGHKEYIQWLKTDYDKMIRDKIKSLK